MMRRASFLRRTPKKRAGHDKAMTDACRSEPCHLRIPGVCMGGIETTVPAHSNQGRHGSGMGIKAEDKFSVPACFSCHAEIDQGIKFSKQEKFAYWDKAFEAWEPVRAKKLAAQKNPATAQTVPGHHSHPLQGAYE